MRYAYRVISYVAEGPNPTGSDVGASRQACTPDKAKKIKMTIPTNSPSDALRSATRLGADPLLQPKISLRGLIFILYYRRMY